MGVKLTAGMSTLIEIEEFGGFSSATQRYIRRSLDIGLDRADATALWSRDPVESAGMRVQADLYGRLPDIRLAILDAGAVDHLDRVMGPLVMLSAFDLGQGRLPGFSAYRFLYERLLGGAVRPWLPAAFCAAAALPILRPEDRRLLLQSITDTAITAPGWSARRPYFYPEWVEKVEEAV